MLTTAISRSMDRQQEIICKWSCIFCRILKKNFIGCVCHAMTSSIWIVSKSVFLVARKCHQNLQLLRTL